MGVTTVSLVVAMVGVEGEAIITMVVVEEEGDTTTSLTGGTS